ncbi:MAG: 2-C-methyl-D-erythritol 2,4-cyclodiphosphate synthase [Bacteroidetes bacterium]|nr:2-C-methyl-D-erythritol 2,4-cyclodiphosphate synthase [Bacteroidota bacterium]MCK6612103.1 2-C-methyl-D-erythritol 2,4-cyclodiphosphate synthase [Bacteroidia bacterium]
MYRIGFGFDVHQLVEGRPFILGGVRIDAQKGILGHSDADVLLHAVSDAILGALALGDIGQHFPNTDKSIEGIDSKKILARCMELIQEKGYEVNNLDCCVVCEKPKIMPHALAMRETISSLCATELDNVSVKATTNEKLGFIGREEGIVAYATVMLRKRG